jgi:hypothetical protein
VKNPDGQRLGHLPLLNGIGHLAKHFPSNKNCPSGQAIHVVAEPRQAAHSNEQYLHVLFSAKVPIGQFSTQVKSKKFPVKQVRHLLGCWVQFPHGELHGRQVMFLT